MRKIEPVIRRRDQLEIGLFDNIHKSNSSFSLIRKFMGAMAKYFPRESYCRFSFSKHEEFIKWSRNEIFSHAFDARPLLNKVISRTNFSTHPNIWTLYFWNQFSSIFLTGNFFPPEEYLLNRAQNELTRFKRQQVLAKDLKWEKKSFFTSQHSLLILKIIFTVHYCHSR